MGNSNSSKTNEIKNEEINKKIINQEIYSKPNNYLKLFDLTETNLKIKEIGSYGKNPLQFYHPNSIFFDEKNEIILISDSNNNRIQIINS